MALRRERFRAQMQRSTLSRQTGISPKHLRSIESGKTRRVHLDTAARIAEALGKDIEDIFPLEDVIG
jgi:DNA-binding XRE family transcriptional regulator